MIQVSKSIHLGCIGIDFGTTNSVVTFYNGEDIEFIDFDGKNLIETQIDYFGQKILRLKDNISKEDGLKIENGIRYKQINDEWVNIVSICGEFFRKLRHVANNFFKNPVKNCVITVPARYDEYQRQMIIESANLGGWRVVRLIAEPTAAFLAQEIDQNGVYGVYDLGGGTFDFSLIRKQDDVFQVLGTTGSTEIGMNDFDAILATNRDVLMGSNVGDIDINDLESLLVAVRNLRESGQWHDLSCCNHLIDETLGMCEKLIRDVKQKPKKIIVVGGGALNPYIVSRVEELRYDVVVSPNPQLDVGKGAGLYADSLMKKNLYLVIDVTPLSLGVETTNGMVEWIIPRNSPLPCIKKMLFTNTHSLQTHIKFNIVQGEGIFAQDCRSLGEFSIEIKPKMIHTAKIEVVFSLDLNGLIYIQCNDLETGKSYEIQVDSSKDLTPSMVKKIISANQDGFSESEQRRQFLKCCDEIDLVLRNFPDEKEIIDERAKIRTVEDAKSLLQRVEKEFGPRLQKQVASVVKSIYDDLVKNK